MFRHASILNLLNCPAFLVRPDPLGSIWDSNEAASKCTLLQGDADGGLVANCVEANRRLQYALSLHAKGLSYQNDKFVFRPRPDRHPAATVCVGPTVMVAHTRLIAVAVMEQHPPISAERIEVFRQCFELTPGEARLLALILEGHGSRGAAKMLGISSNTTKTQLSSIFQKTGVSNQLLLARLFFLGPF